MKQEPTEAPEGMTTEQADCVLEGLIVLSTVLTAINDDKTREALRMGIAALRRSAAPPEPCHHCAALQATIDRLVAINTRLESATPPENYVGDAFAEAIEQQVAKSAAPPVGETVEMAQEELRKEILWLGGEEYGSLAKLDALIAAVRVSALHAQTWQPMDTVPPSVTRALFVWPAYKLDDNCDLTTERVGEIVATGYRTGQQSWVNAVGHAWDDDFEYGDPVAWQPLPSPPDPPLHAQRDEQTKDIP